jgi:hypothetical protein
MKEMRKLKIGLAGVMATPFRGDKEGNFLQDRLAFTELGRTLGFELKVIEEGIYRQDQANNAARELQNWGADFILLQNSSFAAGQFIYPFADTQIRLGLWAVPEGNPTSEGGLPLNSTTGLNLYNSLLKTYRTDYDLPVKWFFGRPGQYLFDRRLKVTVQALTAVIHLQNARIGLVGGVADGFDNLIVDPRNLKRKIGAEMVTLDFDSLLKEAQAIKNEQAIQSTANDFLKINTRFDQRLGLHLEKLSRLELAYQQAAGNLGLDAVAISCWPRYQSDYGVAVCSLMGQLNTHGLVAACEGDVPSAAGMLALRYLSGGDVVTLMDLVTVDEKDDSVLLWHCGPTAPALADDKGTRMQSLWLFDQDQKPPFGLHNDLVLKPGQATVMGFTPDFEQLLVLDGEIDNQKPSYMGSRGWYRNIKIGAEPASVPDLVQTLMQSGYQHHYPLAYGSLMPAAMEMAAWLGIAPIQKQLYTDYLVQ